VKTLAVVIELSAYECFNSLYMCIVYIVLTNLFKVYIKSSPSLKLLLIFQQCL